jgi:Family of unknown function (DUF5947)
VTVRTGTGTGTGTGPTAGSGTGTGPPGAGALYRTIRRPSPTAAEPAERCDLCDAGVPDRHRHVLDAERDEPLCVCQACTPLFDREEAGGGHYQLIPERKVRLPEMSPGELGIPVGLAFVVVGADGAVLAHYPSPVGATQYEIEGETWARAVERCPPLLDLAPRVEAVLVNTARGADERWIVPIDVCYRLVALVRREWTGLSGGGTVWPAVEAFFAALVDRPRPGRGARAQNAPPTPQPTTQPTTQPTPDRARTDGPRADGTRTRGGSDVPDPSGPARRGDRHLGAHARCAGG